MTRYLLLSLALSSMLSSSARSQTTSLPPGTGANSAPAATSGSASSVPLRIGRDVKPPRAISTPDPDYSEVARKAGYEGTVILRLVVDTDGTTKDIEVVRKLGMGLDEAAVAAVERWRFQPATKNDQPVPVQITVEVGFKVGLSPANLPLHSPSEADARPPQFPGADLKKYPLVVHVTDFTAVPSGNGYEVRATASFDDSHEPAVNNEITLFCGSYKSRCSTLWTGYYPARWVAENQRLEIVGHKGNGKGWEKAEYTVRPAAQATP